MEPLSDATPAATCDLNQECELTILMPCLNEARTVVKCITKAAGALKRLGVTGEVLVADNGSTDGSQDLALAAGARVIHVDRRGYGAALQTGIAASKGRYIIMGDADDSYDFGKLDPFLERLRAGDDLVMGNRFKGGIMPGAMPWHHQYIGNPVLTGILNLFYSTGVRDAHCGLRGFRKDGCLRLDLRATGMEFASEILVKAALQGQKISEVPIILYPDGRDRPPHLRSFRDGWRHLRLMIHFCPRRLFVIPVFFLLATLVLSFFLPSPQSVARDVFVAPFWILANAFIGGAAWKWARRLFPEDSYLELIGHCLVVCWGSIVVAAILLGLVGWISGPMLLSTVAFFAAVALISERFWPSNQAVTSKPSASEGLWLWAWGALAAYWVLHVILSGLLKFPDDWDTLEYHLPLVDLFLQAGTLYVPDGNRRCANPGNNEILALWFVAPFSGDFFVHLTNLGPTILLACVSVKLATETGLSRLWANLFGFVVLSHFVIIRQLVNLQNDVSVAACFSGALWYSFRHFHRFKQADLLLGAVCLGLLAGIKYYAAGYAILVLGTWGMLAFSKGLRRGRNTVALATLGLITFGGYWYIRNTVATGSPFYPKEYFRSTDLFSVIYPEMARSSFFGNGSPDLLPLYVKAIWDMMGPCQVFAFFLAPFAFAWLFGSLPFCWFSRQKPGLVMTRFALSVILVGTAILFAITPMAVENSPGTLNQLRRHYVPTRYGLCFLNMAVLCTFCLVDCFISFLNKRSQAWPQSIIGFRFASRASVLYTPLAVGLGLAIVFQVVWGAMYFNANQHSLGHKRTYDSFWHALESFLTVGYFILAAEVVFLFWPSVFYVPRRFCVVCCACSWICVSLFLSESWHGSFVDHYKTRMGDGLDIVNQQDSGTRICALVNRPYPLFGSRRQFYVCRPYYAYSPDWLMSYLKEKRVRLIYVYPFTFRNKSEIEQMIQQFDMCYKENPDVLRILFIKEKTALFGFNMAVDVKER